MKNIGKYTFFYKDKIAQWNRTSFKDDDGIEYFCAEQYMMAKKALLFNDLKIHKLIMESKEPKEVQDLGRLVKNFDNVIWDNNKFNIVLSGNLLKFKQNKDLLKILLDTNDTILVEASPIDIVWGIGLDINDENITNELMWRGQNLLGKVLMEVRKILKE